MSMCKPGKRSTRSSKRQKTDITSAPTSPSSSSSVTIAPSSSPLPWPKYHPCNCKNKCLCHFPPGSLLHGLDYDIWAALAHVDPRYFNTKQPKVPCFICSKKSCPLKHNQVAIRQALKLINLEWVSTNVTSVRPRTKPKFDGAKIIYEANGWRPPKEPLPPFRKMQVEDVEWANDDEGGFDFVIMTNNGDDQCVVFPSDSSERIHASMEKTGMAIIRGAVDKPTIKSLRYGGCLVEGCHSNAAKIETMKKVEKLTFTSASGLCGEDAFFDHGGKPIGSHYANIKNSTYLNQLQAIILRSLDGVSRTEAEAASTNERKCILLKYSKGGVNWAHRDGNCNYQALLMLSGSDEYEGGEFYVVERKGECRFTRTYTPKLNAGDLVLFRSDADGGYDHGMMEVTEGERIAVGLLQPGN